VHYVDGFEELYDLVTDPYELENKAHDPSYAGDIATLRGSMTNSNPAWELAVGSLEVFRWRCICDKEL